MRRWRTKLSQHAIESLAFEGGGKKLICFSFMPQRSSWWKKPRMTNDFFSVVCWRSNLSSPLQRQFVGHRCNEKMKQIIFISKKVMHCCASSCLDFYPALRPAADLLIAQQMSPTLATLSFPTLPTPIILLLPDFNSFRSNTILMASKKRPTKSQLLYSHPVPHFLRQSSSPSVRFPGCQKKGISTSFLSSSFLHLPPSPLLHHAHHYLSLAVDLSVSLHDFDVGRPWRKKSFKMTICHHLESWNQFRGGEKKENEGREKAKI